MLDLIRGLLQDPEYCRRVGDAARNHVLTNHTYRHRAEQLLETMCQSLKLSAPRHEDYFPALMSLSLLDTALRSVGRATSNASGGRSKRVLGQMISVAMIAVAAGISLIEYCQERFRRK